MKSSNEAVKIECLPSADQGLCNFVVFMLWLSCSGLVVISFHCAYQALCDSVQLQSHLMLLSNCFFVSSFPVRPPQ